MMKFSKNSSLWGFLAFEVISQTSCYAAWSNQRQPKCLLKGSLLRSAAVSCCSLFMGSGFCSGQLLSSNLLVDRIPSAQTCCLVESISVFLFWCLIEIQGAYEQIKLKTERTCSRLFFEELCRIVSEIHHQRFIPQCRTSASCRGHKRPLSFGRPIKSRR